MWRDLARGSMLDRAGFQGSSSSPLPSVSTNNPSSSTQDLFSPSRCHSSAFDGSTTPSSRLISTVRLLRPPPAPSLLVFHLPSFFLVPALALVLALSSSSLCFVDRTPGVASAPITLASASSSSGGVLDPTRTQVSQYVLVPTLNADSQPSNAARPLGRRSLPAAALSRC